MLDAPTAFGISLHTKRRLAISGVVLLTWEFR
jgi:hypothetical protein